MDDRKKRKSSVLPVWRPVSTKSGTTASKVENLPKDLGCGSGSGFDLELKEEVMEETLIVQGSELTNEVGKVSASIPVC